MLQSGPVTPTVEHYLQRKRELTQQFLAARGSRVSCMLCRKPPVSCYCAQLAPIATRPRIVVLMHPLEARHPVGAGRMSHRCLSNSNLWIGENFVDSREVNELLTQPDLAPVLLFPGPKSLDLSKVSGEVRASVFPPDREPLVIVLDATWNLAKKMLHRSPNLQTLPRICFTPSRLSRFLVRKQPHPQCFSTIEAIHEVLDLFGERGEGPAPHDHLLNVFDGMVAKQLAYRAQQRSRHAESYLARKARRAARLLAPHAPSPEAAAT